MSKPLSLLPKRSPGRPSPKAVVVNWQTPERFIVAATEVMGPLDLILSSSVAVRENMQRPWEGRIFVSAIGAAKPIVQKFVTSQMREGILLTSSESGVRWWNQAFDSCTALCFTRGRIRFLKATGDGPLIEQGSPACGQTFFYFGDNVERFANVFARAAYCRRPDPKKRAPVLVLRGEFAAGVS